MAERPGCAGLRAVAAELALGTIEGRERGEALAHLATCPACRAHVEGLSEAVDQLLVLAPEAEPPAGFESAVLARVEEEQRRAPSRPRRGRQRVVAAAAAVLLLLAGLGAGLLIGGDARSEPELASAPMVAPDGETVGEVWRYGDDGAVLVVSVPAWAELAFSGPSALGYALRLQLDDGRTTEVGHFTLGRGRSSWATPTDVEAARITAVSVVDETGHVWCTGRFA